MRFGCALCLLFPLGTLAALQRSPEIDRTFAALERAWSAAYLKHDVPAIEQLLADEFVGVDGRGVTSTRADELAEARPNPANAPPPPMEILSEEISDVQARLYGETAVVTAVNTATVHTQDGQSVIRYRRSTVWVRRSGRWQCVHFHASRIV